MEAPCLTVADIIISPELLGPLGLAQALRVLSVQNFMQILPGGVDFGEPEVGMILSKD
jgi:hypothetical protein